MPFFSHKKPVPQSEPVKPQPPERKLPPVDFKTTPFENIEPGHMKIFLTQAFANTEIFMSAKELISVAYQVNEMFIHLNTMFEEPRTFGQLKTGLEGIINTGVVNFHGEVENLSMSERGMFLEAMAGFPILEDIYKDINQRSGMYFPGGN